jgi:hypothetical protein
MDSERALIILSSLMVIMAISLKSCSSLVTTVSLSE